LSDSTAVLFGLEDEFRVLQVCRTGAAAVTVIIEQTAREGPCPTCGVLSSAIKDRTLMRVKDLPASGQTVELWWRKRRLLCGERLCPRRSFTQTAEAVRPRGRVTERLRDKSHPRSRPATGPSPTWPPSTGCRGRPPTEPW
jgi:transposase